MDILEMKENAAWERSERERDDAVAAWNKEHKVGELVAGPYWRATDKGIKYGSVYAKTTSAAYADGMVAVVDVEGTRAVPIRDLKAPEGSSPAMAIECPVCKAKVGAYCVRGDGTKQITAHKKRRDGVAPA